jgi:hypothetical protein
MTVCARTTSTCQGAAVRLVLGEVSVKPGIGTHRPLGAAQCQKYFGSTEPASTPEGRNKTEAGSAGEGVTRLGYDVLGYRDLPTVSAHVSPQDRLS